jgi:hypothetical protein
MMTDVIWAGAALAVTAMICWTALRAWRGWLDLRRFEIAACREPNRAAPAPSPAARIEMADIRERLRKLEAIAQGVDL